MEGSALYMLCSCASHARREDIEYAHVLDQNVVGRKWDDTFTFHSKDDCNFRHYSRIVCFCLE